MLTIEEAVLMLQSGKVIAYPTEAVYGLGSDPMNQKACETILTLKHRPESAGFIIIASNIDQLQPYIQTLKETDKKRLSSHWPKHTTLLLPAKKTCPEWLCGQYDTVACRITHHPVVRELCNAYTKAIVSTSANLSGHPPARSIEAIEKYFGSKVDILLGDLGNDTKPSTIIDWQTQEVLRD